MTKLHMNPEALAELIRMSDEARNEYVGAAEAHDQANRRRDIEAIALADWVVDGFTPTPERQIQYEKARKSVEVARAVMSQKYDQYSRISDQLLQEMQKPPAVAPAEGDETKTNVQERCDFNA